MDELFNLYIEKYPNIEYNDKNLDSVYENYCGVYSVCSKHFCKLFKNDNIYWKQNDDLIEFMNKYFFKMMECNIEKENINIEKIKRIIQFEFHKDYVNISDNHNDIPQILQYITKKKEYDESFKRILNFIKEDKSNLYYDTIFKTIQYLYIDNAHDSTYYKYNIIVLMKL